MSELTAEWKVGLGGGACSKGAWPSPRVGVAKLSGWSISCVLLAVLRGGGLTPPPSGCPPPVRCSVDGAGCGAVQ